jgi:pimeloyl-ACP methyl ester carboxylesterase
VESRETSLNRAVAPANTSSSGTSSRNTFPKRSAVSDLRHDCLAYHAEGSGPLLVYVCGLDGTGELFFKQIPSLARSFRVVTFRQRDGGDFSYEDLAADVAAIIRDTGESRATIVAESFGGGVAMTFALMYPQMVERMVIVNSFSRYRERIRIRLAAWGTSWIPFKPIWPLRCVASYLGLYIDGVSGEDRRRFFKAVRTVNGKAYARRLRMIAEVNLDDRLAEIQAPTLLVATKKDMLVRSIREAKFMAERLPNVTVKLLTTAGHACLLSDSVRLVDFLAEWMGAKAAK